MRRCLMLCLLFLLPALALSTPRALATPTISGYSIAHDTIPSSYWLGVFYRQGGSFLATPEDSEVILQMSVTLPGAASPIVGAPSACTMDDAGTVCFQWFQLSWSLPAPGVYTFAVTYRDGENVGTVSLDSDYTWHFPDPAYGPQLTSPTDDAVVRSTTPTFAWTSSSALAFGAEGGALHHSLVQVWSAMAGGGALIWNSENLSPGVTSTSYGPSEAWPPSPSALARGHSYSVSVAEYSEGHAMGEVGWYSEMINSVNWPEFSIKGPTPVVNVVHLCRGVSVYPSGAAAYGEDCVVSATDLLGVDRLHIQVRDPGKVTHPAPGDGVEYAALGAYLLQQHWWNYQEATPPLPGTYRIKVTDGEAGGETLHLDAMEPAVAPAILSPLNGEELSTGTPTFSWEGVSPNTCTLQVWVEELPDDGAADPGLWSPWGPRGNVVWYTCVGPVGSVTYNQDGSATLPALGAGPTYRFHVMANIGESEHLISMPSYQWSVMTVNESMVDFTVQP